MVVIGRLNCQLLVSFESIDLMENMNSKINEYNFYKSQGFSEEQIKEFIVEDNFYIKGDSLVINETRTGFGKLSFNPDDWTEDKLFFSAEFFK